MIDITQDNDQAACDLLVEFMQVADDKQMNIALLASHHMLMHVMERLAEESTPEVNTQLATVAVRVNNEMESLLEFARTI